MGTTGAPPHPMRMAAAALAALLAVLIASPVAAQQPPLTFLGLTFPGKIDGAQAGKPFDFEKSSPGVGYSVEYLRPGWKIDVYIYDLGLPSIPEDVQSAPVKEQFEEAKDAIFKSPNYENVAMKSAYIIADAQLQPRFLCGTFAFKHKTTGDVDSILCVTSWKNKFVKFRLTTKRQKGTETEAKNFVEAWTKVLWPST